MELDAHTSSVAQVLPVSLPQDKKEQVEEVGPERGARTKAKDRGVWEDQSILCS